MYIFTGRGCCKHFHERLRIFQICRRLHPATATVGLHLEYVKRREHGSFRSWSGFITDLTGDKASIKFPPKRIMFQIGYDEQELNARAELFRRVGHEVISVPNNEAAKQALASIDNVDVFVVGYQAPEQTRKEMVDWLKENFPKVKVVALVPSPSRQSPRADYNIVLNDLDEWLALVATTAS